MISSSALAITYGNSLLNLVASALIVFVIGLLVGFIIRRLLVAAIVVAVIVLFLLLLGIISPRSIVILMRLLGFSLAAATFLSSLLLSLGALMIIIFLIGLIIGFFASK